MAPFSEIIFRPNHRSPLRSFAGGCLFLLAAANVFAQSPAPSQPAAPPSASSSAAPDGKKASDATAAAIAPAPSDPRQAKILADTQKLLKLSQELKAEVSRSNKDTLSLTVIKKAEEVEKLAKILKEELNKAR